MKPFSRNLKVSLALLLVCLISFSGGIIYVKATGSTPVLPNLKIDDTAATANYIIKADGTGWYYTVNGSTFEIVDSATNYTQVELDCFSYLTSGTINLQEVPFDLALMNSIPWNVIVIENYNGKITNWGPQGQNNLNNPVLSSWTKQGLLFNVTDLGNGVTNMEDNVVIRGQDSLYYMFISTSTALTSNYRDITVISSPYRNFSSFTNYGVIIHDPAGTWEDTRVRVRSILYDASLDSYLLFWDGIGSSTSGIGGASIPAADFPNGTWTEFPQNPLGTTPNFLEGGIWFQIAGGYFCIAYNNVTGYTVGQVGYKNPTVNEVYVKLQYIGKIAEADFYRGVIRGGIPLGTGYLLSSERQITGAWTIGLHYVMPSFSFTLQNENFPVIQSTLSYEGSGVANPFLYRENNIIYMYYNANVNPTTADGVALATCVVTGTS